MKPVMNVLYKQKSCTELANERKMYSKEKKHIFILTKDMAHNETELYKIN